MHSLAKCVAADAVATAGCTFRDGTTLELIRDPKLPETLNLLTWNGRVIAAGAEAQHGGQRYVPICLNPTVLKAVQFPTQPAPKESTEKLFSDTHELLAKHLDQPEPCTDSLVFCVFCSWLLEALPMVPLVWVNYSPGSPWRAAMHLLCLLCRRSLPLMGVGRAEIRSLPMALNPTLILHEPDMKPAMQRILIGSTHRGANISGGGKIVDLFGAKIVLSQSLPTTTGVEDPIFTITLLPSARDLPRLDSNLSRRIGEESQSRFLGYRLRNWGNVDTPIFDLGGLAPSLQELAKSMASSVVGQADLQKRIVSALQPQNEVLRLERSRTIEFVAIEALRDFCHEPERSCVRSMELGTKIKTISAGRGCVQECSPERAGWIMRKLGLQPEKIDARSNGLKLTIQNRKQIHYLAARYRVPLPPKQLVQCAQCDELRAREP
jgi:hypothetical protein